MNKMLSTYGLTRPPFSKDIPASEMLDIEALQAARERLKVALEGRASAVVTGDSGCGKPSCCAPWKRIFLRAVTASSTYTMRP
jgi:hypothetical protein